MTSKKEKVVKELDRENVQRYGYGDIPDELKVFLKKQCQIENLSFFCSDVKARDEGGFIFSDVIFYEIKQDVYGPDKIFRNKFWMFYDTMTMTFIDGHIFLGFTPCVSDKIVSNTILSLDELKQLQGEEVSDGEENTDFVPPVESTAKKHQDPFGRDKVDNSGSEKK